MPRHAAGALALSKNERAMARLIALSSTSRTRLPRSGVTVLFTLHPSETLLVCRSYGSSQGFIVTDISKISTNMYNKYF